MEIEKIMKTEDKLFTASEVAIISKGLDRLTLEDVIKAALDKVDNFEEQKQSILNKLEGKA
jgi:ribosomal 50S subunit-associated protein YjgA (DUF615 family)